METEIQDGFTFICKHDYGDYNIQHTNEIALGEIIIEFAEFLIASGFSQKSIDEYIDLE